MIIAQMDIYCLVKRKMAGYKNVDQKDRESFLIPTILLIGTIGFNSMIYTN